MVRSGHKASGPLLDVLHPHGQQIGNAISKQRMTHWIVNVITLAYQAQGVPCPLSLGEWRPFLFLPFFLMFLLAITANSILLYLIKSQKSLHSPMYVLIGVMAVLDLIMPMFFVPNMLLSLLFSLSEISLTGCLIQMFGLHFIGTFQSTLLFWMALDRYFAICRPLHYHKCMEIPNFLKFFVFAPAIRNGLLMVTMVSLAGRLSFCLTNVIDHCFCEHMALVQLACGDISINNIVGLLQL
ncbi:olfactory receptor 52K1-like [Labeo rohita]|uniref:olfactory receptor 52K1-like n=1 Tax=Labeo rohita TaxID=84645 RepID=UPI0021E1D1F1|nr:olfactory receptor 52K1-like [Labeo rohita]